MLSPEILKKIQKIYIRSRYLANDVFSGEYETAFKGRGIEFEEVREYAPGDDIRSIDWNVSARMGHPFVKIFREEREQTVMLVVDSSASGNFGSRSRTKKEVITEIAAVLAYAATKSNDKVGLLIFSDQVEKFIPPKKGRAHVWHVISEILSFKPKSKKTNMGVALNYLNRVIRRRSVAFVISDFMDKNYQTPLTLTQFRHDVVALVINDPIEIELPQSGLLTFRDLESGALRLIDLSSSQTVEWLKRKQKEEFDLKIRELRKTQVDCLAISTDEDTIELLLKFFRFREKKQR